MTKQILIVVDSINVNDSSGSKANVALIKNLAAIGYGVTVMHFTQKDIHLKGVECISIKEKKYNILYFLSRTQRVIQRYFKINLAIYLETIFGFSFTFFNDSNSIKSALKKLDFLKFDLLLTLSKGASFRPHYAVNKLPHLHKNWLAYIHDPYPFSCYPPPYNWKEPGDRKKQYFFKKVSENAKLSAFPSLLLKDWIGEFFPYFNKTGVVIPHQNFQQPLKKNETRHYFDKSKFNLLHAGNLMKPRNPEGLLEGFKLFLENKPGARSNSILILLGNASYHKKLIKKYNKLIPELFIKLTNVPFTEVYWLQYNVSVNIILEAKAEVSPFLPGKFPHCVSANKPILHLGPKNSETRRLLGESYYYHSSIDDVKNIASCIERLYDLWLKKGGELELDRKDLEYYTSALYLEEVFSKVIFSH